MVAEAQELKQSAGGSVTDAVAGWLAPKYLLAAREKLSARKAPGAGKFCVCSFRTAQLLGAATMRRRGCNWTGKNWIGNGPTANCKRKRSFVNGFSGPKSARNFCQK